MRSSTALAAPACGTPDEQSIGSLAVATDGLVAPGSLDKHEGLPTRPTRCERWPESLWLRSAAGRLVRGRCNGPNVCDYCAMLGGVETREMLTLDALNGDAPTVLVVHTTRTVTLDVSGFMLPRQLWLRAIRRECGRQVECATTVEYQDRGAPHWNNLLKGLPGDAWEVVQRATERYWLGPAEAEMVGQYHGEIGSAGALMVYLAAHFTKQRQWPPRGFKGQRFNATVGYFGTVSRREMREAARVSLAAKRALHHALGEGLEGVEAEARARQLVADSDVEWQLVREAPGGVVEVGSGRRDRVRVMRRPRAPRPVWLGSLFEMAMVAAEER